MLDAKLHRKYVEGLLFCVLTDMWTEISSGCSLRRGLEKDSFSVSAPLSSICVAGCVRITYPACGGSSLGCLLEASVSNLVKTSVLLLLGYLFFVVYVLFANLACDGFSFGHFL